MSVFDLDPQGRRALDEQAALNPLDLSTVKPGFFEGLGAAVGRGVLRGGARAGTALSVAGAAAPIATDSYLSSFATDDVADFLERQGIANPRRGATTAMQDRYFQNVVEDTGQAAVDYWAPSATETGTAGRVLGGLAEIALPLAAAGGNPALLAATEGLERPAALVKEGVAPGTAAAVGTIGTVSTLAGFKLPAAFGTTLAQRLATGAGANLALGAASSGAQYAALKAAGNDKQAEAFNPADVEARSVDLLTGLVFGGLAHVSAPKAPLPQRDAVLTGRNAESFQSKSMPAPPVNDAAAVRGQQALEQAFDQMARGEPVNVVDTINPADFLLPVEATPAAVAPNYAAYRHALESGGRADAANPASSAFGIDQFTAGTWRRIVASEKPAWAQGMSDAELLAARGDPAKSAEMVAALDAQNTAMLEQAGLPVNHHTLYAAHHFGPASARRFARAADDVPMERLITAEQLAANPYLKGKTKGEAIANWDERARRAGVDVAEQAQPPKSLPEPEPFEVFAERTDRTAEVDAAGQPTYAPGTAYDFDQTLAFYDRVVAPLAKGDKAPMPDVLFRVGRMDDYTAAGLAQYLPDFHDGLRDVRVSARALKHIHDSRPDIARPMIERLQDGTLRADEVLPNPTNPKRAWLVLGDAPSGSTRGKDGVSVVEIAANGKGVDVVTSMTVRESAVTKARAKAQEIEATRPEGRQNPHPHRQPEPAHAAAEFLQVGRGASERSLPRQPAAAGEPRPGGAVDAARQAAAEMPDAVVNVGEDGGTTYRSLADEVAAIEAELNQASTDAEAYSAAVSCFLRRG